MVFYFFVILWMITMSYIRWRRTEIYIEAKETAVMSELDVDELINACNELMRVLDEINRGQINASELGTGDVL